MSAYSWGIEISRLFHNHMGNFNSLQRFGHHGLGIILIIDYSYLYQKNFIYQSMSLINMYKCLYAYKLLKGQHIY